MSSNIKIVNITELRLRNFETKKLVTVDKHPYYLSLIDYDRTIFENYVKLSKHQSEKPSGEWKTYCKIYKNLRDTGFDFNNSDKIIIKQQKNNKFYCRHGRHRACMLYKLFGENLHFKVEGKTVVGIILKKKGT
jgi:hypothetical protein